MWIRVLLFLLVLQVLPGVPVAEAFGADRDQPGVVEGVVRSAEASAPLPGANVAVRRVSDSTLVDGTTTDSTGHFVVEDLATGRYTVVVSFVGYTSQSRAVTLRASDPTRTLDPFQLEGTAAQMEGATVSAERPFVTTKGSKRIYSFENSQVALAGKSAVDVLRDLPSLRIDAMDGSIQLRGNQSVSVHVNGKPVSRSGKALVQYLKSLSAANVKRVEVNTNPSARHDAEGTAGIINIVLKEKESEGWSGGLSGSVGMGPRVEGSGNLGYKQGKWTLYGSYGYSQHEHEFTRDLLRRSTDDASTLLLDRTAEQQYGHGGHNVTVEADYALTPKTTLSLASTGHVRSGTQDLNMTTRRGTEETTATRVVDEDDQSVHLDERLTVDHTFADENHTLTADLRYEIRDQRDRVWEEQVPASPREHETKTEDEHNASLKLDYTRPLGDWTIETGYKGSYRLLDQQYDIAQFGTGAGRFLDIPDRSDALTFREQGHAGYGVLQRSIGPIDAEAGLRVEHTQTSLDANGATDRSQYTGLFPSASLTYEMERGGRVSLSYSKRVDRPNAYQLSAFNASADPYVQFVGNPNLEPENIHKAELTVMQTVGPATITVSPYARRKTNAIEWTTVQTDSLTLRTYDNYDARTSFGAELTSSLRFGNDVKATLSGNVYRRRTQGGTLDEGEARDAFAVMGRGNVTWTLLDGLRLQASQMYRSPVTAGVGKIDALMRTSASLEKTFWDDKGSIGLRVEDPFDTSDIGVEKHTTRYTEYMSRDWDGRRLSLSFSYRFGDPNQEKRRDASSGGGGLGGMGGG